MKKIAFLLVLFLFVCVQAVVKADELPKFEDFCPYKSCQNLDVNKKYYAPAKKYWVQRKVDFNAQKAECAKLTDPSKLEECYKTLKTNEEELTNKYIAARSASSYSANRYSSYHPVILDNTYNSTYNNYTYTRMNTYKPLRNYNSTSTYRPLNTYSTTSTYKPLNTYGSTSTYGSNPLRTSPSYSYTNNHFNTWKPTSSHYGYGKW